MAQDVYGYSHTRMDLPMIFLTSYYQDDNVQRQTEIDTCLRKNLENSHFQKIIVVVEGKLPNEALLVNAKVALECIQVESRLTYQDFFKIASSFTVPVILANSDIFFDDSLALLTNYPLNGRFLALSRWEVRGDGKFSSCFLRPDSQDVWIFQPPLPPMAANFMLGQAGCDNRIAWEAAKAGLEVLNPSLNIRAHHLHLSGVRNYDASQKVSGPYLLVAPHHLESDTVRRLALQMDGSEDPAALQQGFEQLIADLPSEQLWPLDTLDSTKGIYLFTSFYLDRDSLRQAELVFCLRQNLANPAIDRIVLFLEPNLDPAHLALLADKKIELVNVPERPTYADFIDFANRNCVGQTIILANSDIFFDGSLDRLNSLDMSGRFLALTRWDVQLDAEGMLSSNLFGRIDSQDSWIFQPPLPPLWCAFALGTPGCDNQIAYEARRAGLQVANPALSIRSHHMHLSEHRSYTEANRLRGPYLLVPPISIEFIDQPSEMLLADGYGVGNWPAVNQRKEALNRQVPQLSHALAIAWCPSVPKPHLRRSLSIVILVHPSNRQWLNCTLASLNQVWDELVIAGDTPSLNGARQTTSDAWLPEVRTDWVLLLQAGEVIDRELATFLQQLRNHTLSDNVETDNLWLQKRWVSPWNFGAILSSEPHSNDFECRLFRFARHLHLNSSGKVEGFRSQGRHVEGLHFYSLELCIRSFEERRAQVLLNSRAGLAAGQLRYLLPELFATVEQPWDLESLYPETICHIEALPLQERRFVQVPSTTNTLIHPRIAIDGVFFQLQNTGIAHVWRLLLEEWKRSGFAEHILLLDRAHTASKIPGIESRSLCAYNFSPDQHSLLEEVCQKEGIDLFISTYYTTPLVTPSVFMAYDMIPEVLGWQMNDPYYRDKPTAIAHAKAYITISESTARDLAHHYPQVDPERITVAHCGVRSVFRSAQSEEVVEFLERQGIQDPYFLLVGTRERHKNALLMFMAAGEMEEDFEIVCVGGRMLEPELAALVGSRIVHLLSPNDEELRLLYAGALALVYPSTYEGFGLPILEAMACGCPVITCHNSSIPEVAGDAVLYIGESDVEGLQTALRRVQDPDFRHILVEAGLEQAKRFSWSRMAEQVAHALLKATLPIEPALENYLLFPNWSQANVVEELTEVLSAWITQSPSPQTALLIAVEGFPWESEMTAEAFLQGILTELFFTSGLVIENPIHFLPALYPAQWQIILKENCTYIPMEIENRALVIETGAHQIPKLQLFTAQLIG
jgi:glycosyltransferase involved in cell wall biosynthesis